MIKVLLAMVNLGSVQKINNILARQISVMLSNICYHHFSLFLEGHVLVAGSRILMGQGLRCLILSLGLSLIPSAQCNREDTAW